MSLRTRLKLHPGQRGTKKLLRIYGERLVCVRYRYDGETNRRVKTVELVVSDVPWVHRLTERSVVGVRIGNQDTELRCLAKGADGRYDGERGLWLLPLGTVRRLGLVARVEHGKRP